MERVWSTAVPDWEERIVEKQTLIPMKPLFPDEAEAALRVFKSLRVVDVPGRPTFGEIAEPWVLDFVRAIFGSYDAENATRLIEEFLLCISKKNGKSTLAAGIMLTALIRNWREAAELLIMAPTIEIAGNSFKPAANMVRADPELRALLHVQDNLKIITHRRTKAMLKVIAADTNTVTGSKAGFILVDELWLFGKMKDADSLMAEATGGRATRHEGFVVYLSTHSDAPPAGIFKDKLEIFRNVRDGKSDDNTKLSMIYEFPPSMLENESYLNDKNWYITNPNMGLSTSKKFIKQSLDDAGADAGKRRIALAKWLNVEIGMNLRGDRWPGAAHWEKNADKELEELYKEDPHKALKRLLERSECVTVGVDGGGLDDIFGFTVIGREPGEHEVEYKVFGVPVKQKMKKWLTWSHGWVHEQVLENRQTIATKLQEFSDKQELTIVGNELIDIVSIVELIRQIKDLGKLGGVGVDPAGLGEFITLLEEIGITEENKSLYGVPQGFGLMNAIKSTERHLAKGLLSHCGGALMPWAITNLKIEPTATAIRATKQNAGDMKIDPAMALFDAASVMLKNPKPIAAPTYEMFVIV